MIASPTTITAPYDTRVDVSGEANAEPPDDRTKQFGKDALVDWKLVVGDDNISEAELTRFRRARRLLNNRLCWGDVDGLAGVVDRRSGAGTCSRFRCWSRCRPGPVRSGWCEVPGVAVVFEAEVDQPFEVDRSGSGGERDFVAFDAAASAASVAVGCEPCDSAFDHWSVLSVVGDQVSVGLPGRPVCCEVLIVFGDFERLAVECCCASRSERTASSFQTSPHRWQ